MKFPQAILLSLVGTLPRLLAASPTSNPPSGLATRGHEHIPQTVGRHFEIDGKVQYFAGTNCWWLGNLLNDFEVELAISQIADVCPSTTT